MDDPVVDGGEEVSIEHERKAHKDLLKDIIKTSKDAEKSIDSCIEKINAGPDMSQGISFLDLKNGLLLEYNTNLTYLMLKKTKGETIEDEKAVERLCYLRTVMEKIRPIEHKLKYQIDKCVKIAETGQVSKDDPSRFKANPESLASKLGEDVSDDGSDEDEDDDDKDKSKQKYVAPRNVPKHYDGDKTKEEKEAEQSSRKKKSALSHSMMKDLQSQLWDTPEEISHQADTKKQKYIALEREKEIYEEDMFIRLPVTKADRIARKNMFTVSNIGDSITSFGNSSFGNDDGTAGKKRKRDNQGKGGKSKKKFKIKKKKF
eukprot:TRINITY_DN5463_c0_g1_i1.p1 TRINITY_DN5463_c0_g1~~TRINITY_DN5463_c0_g1_i1.p1  ORF type:complete len:336 (-),score=121.34 TRINITY_DN5463_c0_g1_i1:28-978(-)